MAIDTTSTLNYTVRICRGTRYTNKFVNPAHPDYRMVFTEAFAWFTWTVAESSISTGEFFISNAGPLGTHTVSLQEINETSEPTGRTGTLTIIISECFDTCETICEHRAVNLIWLNPYGGWSSYVFDAKRTFQLEQGGADTYKTSSRELRYYKKKDVYDGLVVGTGLTTKENIDYILPARYAIQAYEYIDEDNIIPVIIDSESFDIYKDDQGGLYEMSFRFRYSEEKIIQTQ